MLMKSMPRLLQICSELFPEAPVAKITVKATTSVDKIHQQLEPYVTQIYQKYFENFVQESAKAEPSDNFLQTLHTRNNDATQLCMASSPDDVWIFGYGSLVWKADFPYIERRRGYISGYQRRFYQHSIDHRGTAEQPGRVVTLLHSAWPEDKVYGVAYRIAAQQRHDVLAHLDYREKNGYERCVLDFQEFPEEMGGRCEVIMYIATPANESYAGGVWQVDKIAEQIFTSAGPSGTNREYLFRLAAAMRSLFPGVQDRHLFELETAVRRRIQWEECPLLEGALRREIRQLLLECAEDFGNYGDDDANGHVDTNATNQRKSLHIAIVELQRKCRLAGWKEKLLTQQLLLLDESV